MIAFSLLYFSNVVKCSSLWIKPCNIELSFKPLTFHRGYFFRFELGKENDALLLYEQDSDFRQVTATTGTL